MFWFSLDCFVNHGDIARQQSFKETAGIPGPKEFGPVGIHELMYTFLDTFLINLYVFSDSKLTVLRAPWIIFNIIEYLSFSEWVHFGFKCYLNYFPVLQEILKLQFPAGLTILTQN